MQLEGLTVTQLRDEFEEMDGSMPAFNKRKSKDDKKKLVLEHWFKSSCMQGHDVPIKKAEKKVPLKEKKIGSKSKPDDHNVESQPDLAHVAKMKADVLPGIVTEEPELLSKVLILSQHWLDSILDHGKTLELRKTKVASGMEASPMYLACECTIHARCQLGPPLSITCKEEYEALMDAHKCPEPPYSFPFIAHPLKQVQRLTPLQFKKLHGAIGRSLYRPLNWTSDDADAKAKGDCETPPTKSTKANGDCEGENAKKEMSKEKTAKAKAKKKDVIKTLAEKSAKVDGVVKVIDPTEHLRPSTARFESKQEQLRNKNATVDMNISGGLLAHLNNVAFPRAPARTAMILVGKMSSGDECGLSIKGGYVPSWEHQEKMKDWTVNMPLDPEFNDWCQNMDCEVLGICAVLPSLVSPEVSALTVFDTFRKSKPHVSMVYGITCSDRMSTFYRVPDGGVAAQVLGLAVHWVGEPSLYFARVVQQHLKTMQDMKEAAMRSMTRAKGLQSRMCLREQRREQNSSRRPPSRDGGCQSSEPGSHSALLRNTVQEGCHYIYIYCFFYSLYVRYTIYIYSLY